MAYQWVDYDPDFIRQRYDRLADVIALFDWLFCIPPGLRRHAVDRLSLEAGDCVLEVGCGSGRNFPFLRAAVGPSGRIYGVDLSAGMLRRARKLRDRHHWTNIRLAEGDAADYVAPEPLDGVLFSFSYNTMPHHLTVLRQMWKQLRPGGRLVIVDSKLPPGLGGKLLLPFSLWLMQHTLLGNPYIRPWEHHAELVDNFEMEEFLFASYYVSRGVRPLKSRLEMRAPSQRQDVGRDVVGRFRSPLRRQGQRQGTAQANCGRARSRSCRFRRSATAGSSPKLANQRAGLRPRGVGQRLHERRRLLSSASARSCNASSLRRLVHSAGRDRLSRRLDIRGWLSCQGRFIGTGISQTCWLVVQTSCAAMARNPGRQR